MTAIGNGLRRLAAWQGTLAVEDRLTFLALVLLGAAFLVANQPALALGVPAGIMVIAGWDVDFSDRRVPFVLIAAVAAVLVAVILGGR